MRTALLLAAVAASGCNLTYDRDGTKFDPPASPDACTAQSKEFCSLGTREFCADTLSDPENCGGCGLPCEPGASCGSGTCSAACGATSGYQVCGTAEYPACVDTRTDAQNCGSCDSSCGSFACEGGVCHVACSGTGMVECLESGAYVCVDTLNDPAHCGSCAATSCTSCTDGVCGGYTGTFSCSMTAAAAVCQTLTGTLTAAEYAAAESSCTSSGGTAIVGACPAGAVSGYCDAGTPPEYPGTTLAVYYYPPTFTSAAAEASCTSSTFTWVPAPLPAVAPLLPNSGSDWNQWVQGNSWSDAVDAPCDPAASGVLCVHAGELRVVKVPGLADCAGVTAADALGAFDWYCSIDPADSQVRLVSSRLVGTDLTTGAPEKRLADLVDAATLTWRPNKVSVFKDPGTGPMLVGETPWTEWWLNPVAPFPSDGRLKTAGTVYVFDAASPQVKATLEASGIALVIAPPTALRPVASTGAVEAVGRDFLWIEGEIDATTSADGVYLSNVRRSNVRSLTVRRDAFGGGAGLHLSQSERNRLRMVNVTRSAEGILLENLSRENNLRNIEVSGCDVGLHVATGSDRNEARVVSVAANRTEGILLENSISTELDGVVTSNNGSNGVVARNLAAGTMLAHLVAANNKMSGISLSNVTDCRVVAVTAAGNAFSGLSATYTDFTVFQNVVVYGGEVGVDLAFSPNNTFVDLAVGNVASYALYNTGDVTNRIFGSVVLGLAGSPPCYMGGAISPGFYSTCQAQAPSAYTLETVADFTGSFLTPSMVTTDAVNATPGFGSVLTVTDLDDPSIDWTGFQSSYRSWGPAMGGGPLGCSDPAVREQTACVATVGKTWAGQAVAKDWSLVVATDAYLYPLYGRWSYSPIDPQEFAHTWSDYSTTPFLRHAMDRDIVGVGNGDGLCEAGESCAFLPNYGAYQGHGVLYSAGTVTVGAGTASVVFYPTNGY